MPFICGFKNLFGFWLFSPNCLDLLCAAGILPNGSLWTVDNTVRTERCKPFSDTTIWIDLHIKNCSNAMLHAHFIDHVGVGIFRRYCGFSHFPFNRDVKFSQNNWQDFIGNIDDVGTSVSMLMRNLTENMVFYLKIWRPVRASNSRTLPSSERTRLRPNQMRQGCPTNSPLNIYI